VRAVRKKNIKERVVNFILEQEVGTIEAIVLTGEEFTELTTLPMGASSGDPLGQRAIEMNAGRFEVAGIPIWHEGEPGCPK
jgi:hypothetical protein